jgi:Mn-dependent DtxR family transcriptional regulator
VGSVSGRELQFSAAEAHEIADELEHSTSKELAERLDLFLGIQQ